MYQKQNAGAATAVDDSTHEEINWLLFLCRDLYGLPDYMAYIKGTKTKTVERDKKHQELLGKLTRFQEFVALPSELNYGNYSKHVKNLERELVSRVRGFFPGQGGFDIALVAMAKVGQETAGRLSQAIAAHELEEKKSENHKKRIRDLLIHEGEAAEEYVVEDNPNSAANDSFVLTKTIDGREHKFYVKTFSKTLAEEHGTKLLDAREILPYKILERMGFCTGTRVLLHSLSYGQSASGSSCQQGNYIMTEDAAQIREGETNIAERQFFIDGNADYLVEYRQAMDDIQFREKLYTLISLNKILLLRDTFGENPGNYGIVKTTKTDGSIGYHPIIIDPLPLVRNGVLKSDYSPGTQVTQRFFPSDDVGGGGGFVSKEGHSSLREIIGEKTSQGRYPERFSSSEVKGMVYKTISDYLPVALDEARKYVEVQMERCPQNFAGSKFTDALTGEEVERSAEQVFATYVDKIQKNFQTFQEADSTGSNKAAEAERWTTSVAREGSAEEKSF